VIDITVELVRALVADQSNPDPEGLQTRVLAHVLADPVVD
jgi:hypothetical protein